MVAGMGGGWASRSGCGAGASAAAQPPLETPRLVLRVEAPRRCRAGERLVRWLSDRIGVATGARVVLHGEERRRAVRALPHAARLLVELREESEGRWTLLVRRTGGSRGERRRELRGRGSCREAFGLASVVASLLVGEDRDWMRLEAPPPGRGVSVEPAEGTEGVPPVVGRSSGASGVLERSSVPRLGWRASLEGAGLWGEAPGLVPALGVGLGWEAAPWALELGLRVRAPSRSRPPPFPSVGVEAVSMALAGCLAPWSWASLSAEVCLGARGLRLVAWGERLERNRRVSFWALRAEGRLLLRWRVAEGLSLRGGLEVGGPVLPRRYVAERSGALPSAVLHENAPVALGVLVGVVLGGVWQGQEREPGGGAGSARNRTGREVGDSLGMGDDAAATLSSGGGRREQEHDGGGGTARRTRGRGAGRR